MDLSKSRQSKNVQDARKVSTSITLNNRSMTSRKLKNKTPIGAKSNDPYDEFEGIATNPGRRKVALPKKRSLTDPAPQKFKQTKASKSGRAGPTRPQRKNRSYDGPKK